MSPPQMPSLATLVSAHEWSLAKTISSFGNEPEVDAKRGERALRASPDPSTIELVKGQTMGAILELTTYAATPIGMVAIVAIGAIAYFAARWVLVD